MIIELSLLVPPSQHSADALQQPSEFPADAIFPLLSV
jgi:hypothetical protein